jgi:hypothetical protein
MRLPEPQPGAELGSIQKGRALWAVLPRAVVAMWSTVSSVEVHDSAGRLIRTIRLPLTRRVLTERDIAVQVKRYGSMARGLEPGPAALTNMLYAVNDSVFGMLMSGLWGAAEDPPLPDGSKFWRLFSVTGEYLGVVRQPDGFRYLGRGDGTLWARVLDENAEPVIVEFELARGG